MTGSASAIRSNEPERAAVFFLPPVPSALAGDLVHPLRHHVEHVLAVTPTDLAEIAPLSEVLDGHPRLLAVFFGELVPSLGDDRICSDYPRYLRLGLDRGDVVEEQQRRCLVGGIDRNGVAIHR